MSTPIPVRVTRYQCPHCQRTHSSRRRAVDHIARCWYNPQARGCKTCRYFIPEQIADPRDWVPGMPEGCAVGVDLSGRPACPGCHGDGWAVTNTGTAVQCGPDIADGHVGDGTEVRSGPIVGCGSWRAAL